MKNLLKNWKSIENKLADRRLVLFLDYDGTLAPVSETPDKAILPLKTRTLLEAISFLPIFKLVFVSGRSVSNLKKMVKIRNAIYVGNHGWEIRGAINPFKKTQSRRIRNAMSIVHQRLVARLSHIEGIIIEDKGFTLTVHYRLVLPERVLTLKTAISGIVNGFEKAGILKLRAGKKIIEVLPVLDWNKGKAARQVIKLESLRKGKFFPICVGDDTTDEDLFRSFKTEGLTVRVGKSSSSEAGYYLRDISEMQDFLERLFNYANAKNNGRK